MVESWDLVFGLFLVEEVVCFILVVVLFSRMIGIIFCYL